MDSHLIRIFFSRFRAEKAECPFSYKILACKTLYGRFQYFVILSNKVLCF